MGLAYVTLDSLQRTLRQLWPFTTFLVFRNEPSVESGNCVVLYTHPGVGDTVVLSISVFDVPDRTGIPSKGVRFSSGDDCFPGPSSLNGFRVSLGEALRPHRRGEVGRGGEATQQSGPALRSLRRGSARGRAPGGGGNDTADQSAGPVPTGAQDWAIRSSLSPGRGRAAPGTAWDRRTRCAQVPGARARSLVSRGGWSRAASRRSCWRRRRRRRLAVGRGRGLKTPRWGEIGSFWILYPVFGGPPDGGLWLGPR